ncbi:hypothetical protein M422DRAFT_270854 [Sphaerobolus stellatus SS14]|uniref:GST N-terminal domain-containing protein n=1 Tax=Sphaerobolus stellatus (strain SS14) TaxID=990650 RepID=A0A0C9URH8_SPHS4|nr:hypothetical protein M422DRAFT_270854 [Sphaerobolus stellatus SS14]
MSRNGDVKLFNSTGRIPALIDDENGHVVWESSVILTYIADRWNTTGEFAGKSFQERNHRELHAQYAFIDSQVKGRDWIALDRFSIADCPSFPAWVAQTIAVDSVKKGYKSFLNRPLLLSNS